MPLHTGQCDNSLKMSIKSTELYKNSICFSTLPQRGKCLAISSISSISTIHKFGIYLLIATVAGTSGSGMGKEGEEEEENEWKLIL